MMRFIDTHTHLYEPDYDGDNPVELAISAGVDKMVLPDVCSASRDRMFDLAGKYPDNTFPCLGLHPTEVGKDWKSELDLLEADAEKTANGYEVSDKAGTSTDKTDKDIDSSDAVTHRRKIYAIGEAGLDCHWSEDFLKEQIEVFRVQIEMALKMRLPLIVHCREATAICLNTLEGFRGRGLKGVMHAYSGSVETFRELDKYGEWYVGIGGVLTFKKASIAETVKNIPIERIVLETDAPWLAPVPHRGQRNESAYIPEIASRLAEIKGLPVETVAKVTTLNAERLFSI